MIAAIIIGVFLLVAVILAAVAIPTLRHIKEREQQVALEHLEAVKPKAELTEDEKAAVLAFGEELAGMITSGDAAAVGRMVDVEVFTDLVFLPLGSNKILTDARKGFLEGYRKNAGGLFAAAMGSEAKAIRLTERAGFPAVLVRTLADTGAVAFIDVLVRVEGKSVKVVDIYNHIFGLLVTNEVRNTLVGVLPKGSLGQFFGPGKANEHKLEALSELGTAVRAGDAAKALEVYQGLPPALQKDRTAFLLYLQVLMANVNSSPESDKLYRQALIDAPERLGEEGATDLLRIDLQIMEEDFAGAERSLQRAERVVGRDAYLTFLRSLMMLRQGKVAEAQRLEREAAGIEPDLVNLVDLRLAIFAELKDYPAMLEELRAFKASHNAVIRGDQLTEPEYAEFLKSPEYAKWQAENP